MGIICQAFLRLITLVPLFVDFICTRIHGQHAYRRRQEKLGSGAIVAITGLSDSLNAKQAKIDAMNAAVDKEEQDDLNMLKQLTTAIKKVLDATRVSFEKMPLSQSSKQWLAC